MSNQADFKVKNGLVVNTTASFLSTITSISTTTGGVQISGGVGIAKDVYIGGVLNVVNATSATSTTTGALRVTGGAGFQGDIYARNIFSNGQQVGLQSNTTTNLAGGQQWAIPYQSGTGTTTFMVAPSLVGTTYLQFSTSTGFTWTASVSGAGGSVVYTPYVDTFTGTGSTTTWTLSTTPAGKNYVSVIIDGVDQLQNAWNLSGNTIVFTESPVSGATIEVKTISTTPYVLAVGSQGTFEYSNAGTLSGTTYMSYSSTTNVVSFTSTTNATSTTTGAVVISGGLGIGQDLYVGGKIVAQELDIQYTTVTTTLIQTDDIIKTSNSTGAYNATSGALQIGGGIGVGGSIFVTGNVTATNFYGLASTATAAATAYSTIGTHSTGTGILGGSFNGSSNVTWTLNTATLMATAVTSNNLAGGSAGQFAYQTGAGATSFMSTGSMYVGRATLADSVSNFNTSTLMQFALNIANGTAGQLVYQSAANTTAFINTATTGNFLQANYTGAPTWTTTGSMYVNRATLADTATTSTSAGTAYATIGTHTAGTGLSGTAFNGSANQTWTLNTATLMQVATQVVQSHSTGTGILGSAYNGSTAQTWSLDTSTLMTRAVNLAGGTAGQFAYQSAANTTAFMSTGSMYVGRATIADSASGSSSQVNTQAQPLSATYYPTFVDSNNASATAETVYTTSSFMINPGTKQVGIGYISTSSALTVNGRIESMTDPASEGGQVVLRGKTWYRWSIDNYQDTFRIIREDDVTEANGQSALIISSGTNSAVMLGVSTQYSGERLAVNGGVYVNGIVTATNMFIGPWAVNTGSVNSSTLMTVAVNLASGTAGQLHYQTAPNTSGFINTATTGNFLQANFTGAPTWTTTGSMYVARAAYVDTVAQVTSATYYPAFVDSNNATAGWEPVYTTSSFSVNAATGVVSGNIFAATSNGAGTNFKVGDDAWIGDVNTADTFRVTGQQNAANGYIIFGNNDTTALGRAGSGSLTYGGNVVVHGGNTSTTYVGRAVIADSVSGSAGSLVNALSTGTGLLFNAGTTYDGSAARTISLNTSTYMALAANATSANKVANAHSAGTGLTGTAFDGSAAVTWTLNTATLMATAVTALTANNATNATTATSAGTAYATIGTHTAGTGLTGTAFNGSANQTWTLNTATLMANAVSASSATNLAGGVAGSLPYQSGVNATTFLGVGSANQILTVNSGATAPQWTSASGITGVGSVANSVTFNNSNSGDASGTTYNGSAARTISANTLGALSLSGGGTISGAVTFSGPVTFSGTATYVSSTQTYYTDNIINLHVPPGGVDSAWTTDDGKDIGFRFHYYANSTDTNAALVIANDSKFLEFYAAGAEGTSTFVGSYYGNFKTGNIVAGRGLRVGSLASSTATVVGEKLTVYGGIYSNDIVTATTFVGALTGTASNATTATSAGTAYATIGTLTAGTGLTGTAFNGSANQTWTLNTATLMATAVTALTSNNATSATTATSAATAYATIGTHTAGTGLTGTAFNGSANQTWTLNTATLMQVATQVVQSLSAGTGLTGSAYNGSTAQTWTLNTATLMASAVSAINLSAGSAMALPYQSASGTTAYLAAGTSGYILQTNGTGSAPSWVAASGLSAGSSTNADNLKTIQQTASANYYPAFVDSNNSTAAYEAYYTTSSFYINPASGLTTIAAPAGGDGLPSFRVTQGTAPSTFNWIAGLINSSLGSSRNLIMNIGQAESARNCGYIGFNHNGTAGSVSNFLTFGLHSVDNIMNITGNGYVGIGNTAPAFKLAVNTASDVWHAQFGTSGGKQLRIGGSTTNGSVIGAYNTDDNTSPASLLLNRDGGNVGIGLAGPSQLVDAYKSANADVVYQIANDNAGTSATAQFFASNGTTKTQFFHTGVSYSGTGVLASAPGLGGVYNTTAQGLAFIAANASGVIKFATGSSNTERLRITTNGGLAFAGASNYGTSGQILQSNGDAAPTWVSPSTVLGTSFTNSTQEFTATAGQTVFTVTNGYTPSYVQVYANGFLLSVTDYTATNGSTVTLADARAAGDIIRVISPTTISSYVSSLTSNYVGYGSGSNTLTGSSSLTWDGTSFYVNGKVGIGTSSPVNKLHVAGAGNTTGGNIHLGDNTDAAAKWTYITAAHYNGATNATGVSLIGHYATSTDNNINIGGNIYEAHPATTIAFYTYTSNTHTLGGTLRLTITKNGGFAFGSSASNYGTSGQILQSNGDAPPTWVNAPSSALTNTYVGVGSGSNLLSGSSALTFDGTILSVLGGSSNGYIKFASAVGPKLRFYDGASDKYGVEIQSSELRIYSGAGGVSTGGITFGKYDGTTYTQAAIIRNDGNVGIGTTSPGYKLEVNGNTYATGIGITTSGFQYAAYNSGRNRIWSFANADGYGLAYFQGSGGFSGSTDMIGMHFGTASAAASQFSFVSNGNLYATGDIYSSYSDIRLKSVKGKIETPLDLLESIDTFYYEPNELALKLGATPGRKVGVSAQSVEQVMPEAVSTASFGEGEYLTVQYERLVPLLIESIKELRAEVTSLKNEIADLKNNK